MTLFIIFFLLVYCTILANTDTGNMIIVIELVITCVVSTSILNTSLSSLLFGD